MDERVSSSWGNAAEVIMAAAVIIGGGWALIRMIYKRGGNESAIVKALQDNTKSNQEVATELKDFKAETLATLRDHSWRLKILEDKSS